MAFKIVLLVLCLVLTCKAGLQQEPAPWWGSTSTSSRSQDGSGNYNFKYQIDRAEGGANGRQETGNSDGASGSYHITDPDGRSRTVTYTADAEGFKATVVSNERGTASVNPSDVVFNSPFAAPSAPVDYNNPISYAAAAPWSAGGSMAQSNAAEPWSSSGASASSAPWSGSSGATPYSSSITHFPGPLASGSVHDPAAEAAAAANAAAQAKAEAIIRAQVEAQSAAAKLAGIKNAQTQAAQAKAQAAKIAKAKAAASQAAQLKAVQAKAAQAKAAAANAAQAQAQAFAAKAKAALAAANAAQAAAKSSNPWEADPWAPAW